MGGKLGKHKKPDHGKNKGRPKSAPPLWSAESSAKDASEKNEETPPLDDNQASDRSAHGRAGCSSAGATRDEGMEQPTGGATKEGKFDRSAREKKKLALVVAAIDFGTTYSGYAYSFMDAPTNILANVWPSGMVKTPTVVLMDPNQMFHSFGEEARSKYEELINQRKSAEWYYFEKFKMQLYVKGKTLDRDMEIKDILGKSMKAIEVFTGAIQYIRQHLMKTLNDENRKDQVQIKEVTDIHWVLTVPAIWNDLSKHFMREAARNAGIPSESLTIALEPEAGSLFCKRVLAIPTGSRYMVVDIGGGTTDITCHEVEGKSTLKEIHPPSGGDFGGINVDDKFLSILISIFSAPVINKFKKNHMDEYWEMMTDLEVKKRRFNGHGEVRLKFPARLSSRFREDVEMDFGQILQQWPRQDDIKFKVDKMIISERQMKEIYDVIINQIKECVGKLEIEVGDIEYIILVGGFSESPYLQHVMKDNFNNLSVLPTEPSLAVLKGAVIYGHETKAISSRTCRYTYGIARMNRFIPGKHPESKKVRIDGYTFCDDVFNKHIEIGTVVSLDKAEDAKYHKYYPSTINQNMAVLEVYKSKKGDPKFVDEEGCDTVGYVKVDGINPRNDRRCELLVRLIFGGTELIIEVKDEQNDSIIRRSVDFFG